jgi:protein SCO1/2
MTLRRRSMLEVALAGTGAAVLAACSAEKPKAAFANIDITGAEYARSLSLPDVDGRVRSLADFKGKVVIVFFGYAQCPDVCPATLAEIAAMRGQLGGDGAKVQPVFVTVDPERDTAQVLREYVKSFGDDVVALRGTLDQTKAAAREFKVFFAKNPGRTQGSYTIDHTAGSYVFDPQGKVRLFVRYGGDPAALREDVKLLLAGA